MNTYCVMEIDLLAFLHKLLLATLFIRKTLIFFFNALLFSNFDGWFKCSVFVSLSLSLSFSSIYILMFFLLKTERWKLFSLFSFSPKNELVIHIYRQKSMYAYRFESNREKAHFSHQTLCPYCYFCRVSKSIIILSAFFTWNLIWSTLYFCSIHTFEKSEFFEINLVEKCISIQTTRILHSSYLRVLAWIRSTAIFKCTLYVNCYNVQL